jgi:hypothetical protein
MPLTSLPKLPRLRALVPAVALLVMLPPLAWWAYGPTGFVVELVRRSWRMEIEIERLRLEQGSDWCDELPQGAFDITRRLITDPTGQRTAPAEHCRYSLLAWRRQWIARETGEAGQLPRWPNPPLRLTPPGEPGRERMGRRDAYYELELRDGRDHVWTCRTTPEAWQQLRPGQRFRLPVDRWGTADCGSLD